MAISVVCACGKKLQVKDEMAGKKGKCPGCGQILNIPAASPAATATTSAASQAPPGPANDPFAATMGGMPSDPFGSAGGTDLGSPGGLDLGSLGDLGGADPFATTSGAADPLGATMPAAAPLADGFGAGMGGPMAGGYGRPAAKGKAPAASDKPWYLQWYFFAGVGGGLALLLIVIGVVLMFAFSGDGGTPVAVTPPTTPVSPSVTPPQPVAPVTPTPESQPPVPAAEPLNIQVTAAPELTLAPGATAFFDVAIERGGFAGPLQVVVEGLPDKVGTAPVEIPAELSAAKLVLLAAADAAEVNQTGRIVVSAAGSKVEQPLAINVKKFTPPTINAIGAISLSPGGAAAVNIAVERNGHAGPIQVQVTGLNPTVTAKPLEIAAGQSAGRLELAAAAAAPNAKLNAKVVVTVAGHPAEVVFPLHVERVSFRLLPPPVVWLGPGEKTMVDVRVERGSYQGPIELAAMNLPDMVTAAPTSVPDGQTTVKLELSAAADAKDKVRSGKLLATASGATSEKYFIVRVKTGDGSLLPEVNVDPELRSLLKRGSFGGRLTVESKQMLREVFGGTNESEAAVMAGLKWLDKHQGADGHFSLDAYNTLAVGCDCETAMEDKVQNNNTGATALGVLPFLGAGVTPISSPDSPKDLRKYQKTVKMALDFLQKNQNLKEGDNNGNLGGGIYAHALGTIALCEAYALTNDKDLKVPAQRAVRYLLESQQRSSGGWGYSVKSEPDMSVVGWVFLGIRSGQLAQLPVDKGHLDNAAKFLDSVAAGPESNKKSRYAYKPDTDAKLSLTAAGLLSRQYMLWPQTHVDLVEGCKYLMQNLPPETGDKVGVIYYYYYATQVLHHMEGKDWDLWNHFMREHLIRTQEKSGHKQGSWTPEGSDWGSAGGRMYTTSLALLTLEASYRHLPLYRKMPAKGSD